MTAVCSDSLCSVMCLCLIKLFGARVNRLCCISVSHKARLMVPLCVAEEGWLQRVVILGSEAHVIEEIQLFETAQPVDSLTISHSKVTKTLLALTHTDQLRNAGKDILFAEECVVSTLECS